MAKYPNDPHISDKLASLEHELKSVQKRLNAVVASNKTVYGTGGVGGRLSGLSGKVSNLNTSLDERASELQKAAAEFAQKEQEQQGKATTAVESAKNGVNVGWLASTAASAVLGATTVIKKSWITDITARVKDATISIVKSSEEKAVISVTQSKYIDGQKYDAKEVRASIANMEKAQADYKEKYGEESRTISNEINRLKKLAGQNVSREPHFYSNNDKGYNNQCYLNSYAMIIDSSADKEVIEAKTVGYNDIREYLNKTQRTEKGSIKYFNSIAEQFNLKETEVTDFSPGDYRSEEEQIVSALKNSSTGVGRLLYYTEEGCSKGKWPYAPGTWHSVMVMVDDLGKLSFYDPGYDSSRGKDTWSWWHNYNFKTVSLFTVDNIV